LRRLEEGHGVLPWAQEAAPAACRALDALEFVIASALHH